MQIQQAGTERETMQYRILGKTKLQVSALGFGCGAVGGILVKGDRREMVRVVAHAIELGVNYFDTAAIYGDGQSETNLGWVLEELGADVLVGTKVRLRATELNNIEQAVITSVDNSLKRLRRDQVDLIQLHNYVTVNRVAERHWLSAEDATAVMDAFRKLRDQGKVRFWGFNGLGDPAAIRQILAGSAQTAQICFNLLNPSAGIKTPANFPFEDYGQVINLAAQHEVGVIVIRALAGGALSGSAERHANATQSVDPIASSRLFADDVALSTRFSFLVDEGYAHSLVDASIRFVMGQAGISTMVIGISTMEQLEQAVESANHGPLSVEAMARLHAVWATFGA